MSRARHRREHCNRKVLTAALALALLLSLLFSVTSQAQEGEYKVNVYIKIHRIQCIDRIESAQQPEYVDWHYYITASFLGNTFHGEASYTDCGLDKTLDDVYVFEVTTRYVRIVIDLKDDDTLTRPDLADISGFPGGGYDNMDEFERGTSYWGLYDTKTNTLVDTDELMVEGDYYITSGELDGSTDVDENDAALWFSIWDDYDLPVAEPGPDRNCTLGETLQFDGSGSTASYASTLVKYEWDFNEDGIFELQGVNQSYAFTKKGPNPVSLRVTDSMGEEGVGTCVINVVNLQPRASFTYSPTEPSIVDSIQFTDTSWDPDGVVSAWDWDFGDNGTSAMQNAVHTYAKGTYTVTLTVRDENGGSNSTSLLIRVRNQPPTAGFTFSPSNPQRGEEVQFTDRSMDPEGYPLQYHWDFGDGHNSSEQSPNHFYPEAGKYAVTLTIVDEDGNTEVASETVSISSMPISAGFTFTPTDPGVRESVRFTDESQDPEGGTLEYYWDFGDGQSSYDRNPSHAYGSVGRYEARLTISNEEGEMDSTSHSITVVNKFDLSLEVRDLLGLAVGNAQVQIYRDGEHVTSATTNNRGKLELFNMPEGDYRVQARVLGLAASRSFSLSGDSTERVRVIFSLYTTIIFLGVMGGALALRFIRKKA
jgi:PKD repeat protein